MCGKDFPAMAYKTRTLVTVNIQQDSGTQLRIPIRRLDNELPLPQRAHRGDAGVDLMSTSDLELQPGQRALVGTGIAIALPLGYAGFIHPRSGLAAKHGLSIVNSPGTVDADYRGELKVCLINLDPQNPIAISRGDRIAQLVIQKVELCEFTEVSELDATLRGDGGYGSTGVETFR
ncbi:Deoxyuridine 5'-triphosphate nucleotidohydrolase [Corynebacterium freiburgense]|nr:Deoxyuridine 5'-triphosphate nucleotidohydrolase [Corynebacterium freiburgense]